ncbi:MAG: hypothetical protein HOI70_08350, partial [Opitutae bacterium]|nr:hypothetical protein [Opitutae bacterium]
MKTLLASLIILFFCGSAKAQSDWGFFPQVDPFTNVKSAIAQNKAVIGGNYRTEDAFINASCENGKFGIQLQFSLLESGANIEYRIDDGPIKIIQFDGVQVSEKNLPLF